MIAIPPEVIRSFAGVRARVQSAVAARRRQVTLEEARDQVRRVHEAREADPHRRPEKPL